MFIAQNSFPAVELTTKRLQLRMPSEADIAPTVELFTDELSVQWLTAPQPYTLADAETWCTKTAHSARSLGDGISWTVIDLATGAFLGGVGVARTHWQRRLTEIGYGMTPRARGYGYAAEATRAVAEWVLLDQHFHRVELYAAVHNPRSQRVAEKAGFVREGISRNSGYSRGGQTDMIQYSMIPADITGPEGPAAPAGPAGSPQRPGTPA